MEGSLMPRQLPPSGKMVWLTTYTVLVQNPVTSCKLDCEFKNVLANRELQDSRLLLVLKDGTAWST